jgi:hypothetical protein
MKRFIINSCIFLFAGALLFHAKPLFLLYNDRYKSKVAGSEVYFCIEKSKTKNKSKKVLFGDSVAKQLFDSKTVSDTINSLTCNQAISLVGHYILLNNYLSAGNQVDTVYFIFRPRTFQNNLDQVYSYHYFLKPFYKKENYQFFTETVYKQIAKLPYYKFSQYPSVLTSNWAPVVPPEPKVNEMFLSPLSIEYLQKIKDLARQYKFKIIILPTPMDLVYKNDVENYNRKPITENGLEEEFKNYFENIIYLDNKYFSDSSHLDEPDVYTELYKKKFLNWH